MQSEVHPVITFMNYLASEDVFVEALSLIDIPHLKRPFVHEICCSRRSRLSGRI
jgi:hypothetical protein